jgi:poly(A) polymerase
MAVLLGRTAEPAGILERLRCSTEFTGRVCAIVASQAQFSHLRGMPLAEVKRFFRQPDFAEHLELQRLYCEAAGESLESYEFAHAKLAGFTPSDLFPPRLITGDDLIELGLEPGPKFRTLLEDLETAQLEGRILGREDALAFVRARI